MEQRLTILPQRLVDVHARAAIACQRLRHEGSGLLVELGGVLHHVLESLHVIGGVQQSIETVVNLLLATRSHLVVRALNMEANILQVLTDFVTKILHMVIRSSREVATLGTYLVAEVARSVRVYLHTGVPPALNRVHLVE